MTPLDELLARLEAATEGSECILWPRALDKTGRGRIWYNGRLMLAHRWAWTKVRGPIPVGKLLCHTCDNPTCINPWHLYAGTHADNMADMQARQRFFYARDPDRCREILTEAGRSNTWSKGANNGRAKITAGDAVAIRGSPLSERALAKKYGISNRTVGRIRHGEIWA